MKTFNEKRDAKRLAALLAMLISIMPFSTDAYLPSLPQIALSLNTNIHHVEKSLSSFIFGVAVGQLVGGSLSDIHGRRKIALWGLAIYLCSSMGLIFVQTVEQLLSLRMVQAVGGGMASVVVGAIVRDNYRGKESAQMFALIGIILMGAPLIAPMLGSLLQSVGGWRSVFVFLFVYGLLVTWLSFRFLPFRQPEAFSWAQLRVMAQHYGVVLRRYSAMGFLFYQAASFSAMIAFLTESPFVYMQLYHLSAYQYAVVFGCNVLMMMLCNRLTAWGLRHHWESRDLLKIGITIQVCANVLLFGIVLLMKMPPLSLLATLVVISVGTQGLIVANTQALFMSQFQPEVAGSANAIISAGQSFIAALVGFWVTKWHNGTALTMSATMAGVTVLGVILLWSFSGTVLRRRCAA